MNKKQVDIEWFKVHLDQDKEYKSFKIHDSEKIAGIPEEITLLEPDKIQKLFQMENWVKGQIGIHIQRSFQLMKWMILRKKKVNKQLLDIWIKKLKNMLNLLFS